MVLGKLDRYLQKNETRSPTYTIHKNNSNWIKDLNIRWEMIKNLRGSTRFYSRITLLFKNNSPFCGNNFDNNAALLCTCFLSDTLQSKSLYLQQSYEVRILPRRHGRPTEIMRERPLVLCFLCRAVSAMPAV